MKNTENKYKKSFIDCSIVYEDKYIEAERVFEMHWHDYIELEVFLEGKAEHICNSELREITKGHAYIITPRDHHAYHFLEESTLITLAFDINILEKELRDELLFSGNKNFHCVFSDEKLKVIEAKLLKIKKEQNENKKFSTTLIKAYLYEIITEILRSSGGEAKNNNTLVGKTIAYVYEHFKETISLTALAENLSVTPNYLGKTFKNTMGISFNNYLMEIRLKYATNMLRFSAAPIKEIALLSGFSSVEYFFLSFKDKYNITPLEYRKRK